MKHPSLRTLQEYFEAESESVSIKEHLEVCDRCSRIVSEMAKVDIYFSKGLSIKIGAEVREKVFTKATDLLKARRNVIHDKATKKQVRKEQSEKVLRKISKLRSDALNELKLPIMQSAALAMAILVFTKVSTSHTEIEHYTIIENDIQVMDAEPDFLETFGEDYENI